jgi:hypothetical protein
VSSEQKSLNPSIPQFLNSLSCKYRPNTGNTVADGGNSPPSIHQRLVVRDPDTVHGSVAFFCSLLTAHSILQQDTVNSFGLQNGNRKRQPEAATRSGNQKRQPEAAKSKKEVEEFFARKSREKIPVGQRFRSGEALLPALPMYGPLGLYAGNSCFPLSLFLFFSKIDCIYYIILFAEITKGCKCDGGCV